MTSIIDALPVNDEQQRLNVIQKDFTDATECLEFIETCEQQSVILTLSQYHSQDRQLVLRFKKLSQIIFIYRSITEVGYRELLDRWSLQGDLFVRDILRRNWINTKVQNIDPDGQVLLMETFLLDLIVNLPTDDKAKDDFLSFCDSWYKNDPAYETFKRKIQEFKDTYRPENAIEWYTDPGSFIFRIVNRTFASINMVTLFKIRFILHDLYRQLQILHEQQLQTRFQEDIKVYRGMPMSINEFNRFENIEDLFITRNFLSTSLSRIAAGRFSGEGQVEVGKVSVVIFMKIERSDMQDKPIAFIGDHTTGSEEEVMLPMGLVFKIDPNMERSEGSTGPKIINMIRGKDERRIEETLQKFHLLSHIGVTSTVIGMAEFLASTQNGQHLSTYVHHMSNALQSTDPQLAEQLSHKYCNQLQMSGNSNVQQVQLTNTNVHEVHINIEIPNEPNDILEHISKELINQGATNIKTSNAFTGLMSTLSTKYALIAAVATIAILSAIVIPVVVKLTANTNSNKTTPECPAIVCSTTKDVRNPSSNYQVEQLNLTCSDTLIYMNITQIIQRTYNETYAQQYQTFWNQSTNETYVQTATQLIYYWWSLPGMYIVKESFPNFIEAQYYYTPGSVRNTSLDTWDIWLEWICGNTMHLSGTF